MNDDSVVVHVRGEGLDLLLTGDIESTGLTLVSPPRAEWIVLPHHGSYRAQLDLWLDRVRPRGALASTGRTMPRDTAKALRERGISGYTAGRAGVVLRPREGRWQVVEDEP